jgi:hypothetical protein
MDRQSDARRVLNELEELAKKEYVPPRERAINYVGLNDKDNAIYWLEKSITEGSSASISINVEPLFDDLRSDERFQELISRMNFKPSSAVNYANPKL